MTPLLSIVIPTYNRKDYLCQTLKLLESQIIRNSDEVNLYISNNASSDGTGDYLEKYHKQSPFFEYVNHPDFADIGISISRSNDMATGDFVLMWGDDDMPVPYFVDYILDCIKRHPEVSLFHYNRLQGRDYKKNMVDLTILQKEIGNGLEKSLTVKDCVEKYILDMSFLSSDIFRRSFWIANKEIDCSKHYGYEFLGHILHGMENESAIYIEFPMCIQRKPANRPWMKKSPLYRFIGIPNMYKDFEKWGLTDDAKTLWMNKGNRFMEFLVVISQTSLSKSFYRPLFREIVSHEYSLIRKIITFFFIFLCPSFVYKIVRKRIYKN